MKKTNKNNINETKKDSAAEFKKRYADLEIRAKAIKTKLKDALNDAKSLRNDANELYWFANDNLYVEDKRGVRPTMSSLSYKMGMLEFWQDIQFNISKIVENW